MTFFGDQTETLADFGQHCCQWETSSAGLNTHFHLQLVWQLKLTLFFRTQCASDTFKFPQFSFGEIFKYFFLVDIRISPI